MAEFESWEQYREFAQFVMRKSRHILDEKNRRFLDAVIETSAKRSKFIAAGYPLWRAQLGHTCRTDRYLDENGDELVCIEVPDPFPPERMIPLADRAHEGRVNPKGIPCLYFSTDKNTAMTEVRPWMGSYVSVAQFIMLHDLSVVDCSSDSAREWAWDFLGETPERGDWEKYVWGDINAAFAEPVTRTDDVAEYAPTQVLAEAFRAIGYGGIIYGSKLGTGKTIAVFDLTAADLVSRHLCRVTSVGLDFDEVANPYYSTRYAPPEISQADRGTETSAEAASHQDGHGA